MPAFAEAHGLQPAGKQWNFQVATSEREGTLFQGYRVDQNPGHHEAITGQRRAFLCLAFQLICRALSRQGSNSAQLGGSSGRQSVANTTSMIMNLP